MKHLIAILSISIVVISCKKESVEPIPIDSNTNTTSPCDTTFIYDNILDTIHPSDYLMAYPGSWWEYSDGSTIDATSWSEVAISSKTIQDNCVTITYDNVILPSYNGYSVANKSYVFEVSSTETRLEPILDTTIGTFYQKNYYYGSGSASSTHTHTFSLEEKLNSLTVNGVIYGDVLHVKYRYEISHYQGYGPDEIIDRYFAKNVGLIKEIRFEEINSSTDTFNLVNHFIAPH